MTIERFNEIVNEFTDERIKKLLVKKANEYSLDNADRLANFKSGANIASWDPIKVLFGYQLKHITSYIDMINSDEKFSRDLWLEKTGDIVNYCILLLGLLEDEDKFKKEEK